MKTQLCILTLLFSSFLIFSQAPGIEWQRSLGGTGFEYVNSIQQTTDGGYIIAGSTDSNDGDVSTNNGNSDYWIVKLDQTGQIEWEKSLGGSGYDFAYSIRQTTDGGYIVAGESASNDGDVTGNHGWVDYWIVKLDQVGEIEWEKSLGGSDWDIARSAVQTSDGGYIVAGYSKSNDGDVSVQFGNGDYWIVKLDEFGNIEWEKSYGGSFGDFPNEIQQTTDGGYIIIGDSQSLDGDVTGNQGLDDYWVIKLDANGTIEWDRSLGGSDVDYGKSVQQTADGGYILAGYANSSDGDVSVQHGVFDYWIVKLNVSGQIEWEKSLGGSGFEAANSIRQTPDGGYIIAGGSTSIDGDVSGNLGGSDYWIVRIDPLGDILWEKSLGGTGFEAAMSIAPTFDGGFIIAGHSDSTDGDVTGNLGFSDFWIVKLEPEVLSTSNFSSQEISLFPNPAIDILHFTADPNEVACVKVYDVLGKILIDNPGNKNVVPVTKLKSGVYILEIENNQGKKFRKKFIKQ